MPLGRRVAPGRPALGKFVGKSPAGSSDLQQITRFPIASPWPDRTRTLLRDSPLPRARATGLEPATSGVTGRRSNQLNYARERALA